jgi:BNR/Asp-box repeat
LHALPSSPRGAYGRLATIVYKVENDQSEGESMAALPLKFRRFSKKIRSRLRAHLEELEARCSPSDMLLPVIFGWESLLRSDATGEESLQAVAGTKIHRPAPSVATEISARGRSLISPEHTTSREDVARAYIDIEQTSALTDAAETQGQDQVPMQGMAQAIPHSGTVRKPAANSGPAFHSADSARTLRGATNGSSAPVQLSDTPAPSPLPARSFARGSHAGPVPSIVPTRSTGTVDGAMDTSSHNPSVSPGDANSGVQRGGFLSVQVNVNGAGQNIVGDAANEPSIAVDPTNPNRMAIGWRQFNTTASNFRQAGRAYTQNAGQTWTFPGVLQPGQFRSDPILETNTRGQFFYYSLSTLTSAESFKSNDGGVTFTGPTAAFGGDKAWMTIDKTNGVGQDNIYAAWQRFFGCCDVNIFTRSVDEGVSFQTPVPIPESPLFGTLEVGPDGEVYVAGVRGTDFQDFDTFVIARSSNAQNPAVTPTFEHSTILDLGGSLAIGDGPNPAGLLGQVWVATDHSTGPNRGNVYMLSSVDPPGPDPLDVMFSRSTDGGVNWSNPIRINDDAVGTNAWQWFGTMSVAPDGRIDAVWNDTRAMGSESLSETYMAYSLDGGQTWSRNTPISPVWNSLIGFPNQQKIGDYYDMVSDVGGAHLAYAATFNGEQDVYYLHIAPDCNANGVHDGSDIIAGDSLDRNQNLLPDACDADFNHDQVLNLEDIDALIAAIATGSTNPAFNLTENSAINLDDRDAWLAAAGQVNLGPGRVYRIADADLDSVVDGVDFGIWNSHKFTSVAAWSQGDFNADGNIDGSDFNLWNANKFTSA